MSTKSKPKDNRQRLFWKHKPLIRPAEDGDMKWLKASKSYLGEEIEESFEEYVSGTLSQYDELLILEDRNDKFKSGTGPVGLVGAVTNGYLYEPHVEWFSWASPQNKLRASVAFFQKFRYRDVGVMMVHSLEPEFFRRLKKYIPLYYVGKVPGGDAFARGDDHIFYMKCRGAYVQSVQV